MEAKAPGMEAKVSGMETKVPAIETHVEAGHHQDVSDDHLDTAVEHVHFTSHNNAPNPSLPNVHPPEYNRVAGQMNAGGTYSYLQQPNQQYLYQGQPAPQQTVYPKGTTKYFLLKIYLDFFIF